jgi:hypothetical protein
MKIKRQWFVDAARLIHNGTNLYSCAALYGTVLGEFMFVDDNAVFTAHYVCSRYAQLMRPTRKKEDTFASAFWLDDIRLPNITRRELRIMLLLFAGEALHGEEIK